MLAEAPRSIAPATNSGGLPPTDTDTLNAVAAPHGKTAATAGVPCVSLPNLAAILEHGGGMTPVDVSGVCETVTREECVSRSQRKTPTPEKEPTPACTAGSEATATGEGEPAVGVEPDSTAGSTEEGREATSATPERLHNELDGVHAPVGETKEVRDTAYRTATADSGADGRDDNTAEGHDGLMNQDQIALTVSFTAVSECKAVREWVRRGAYTLPAFDVTSGQRRGVR